MKAGEERFMFLSGRYFRILFLASVLVFSLLSACSNPVTSSAQIQTNMSSPGSLQINLIPSENDRAWAPCR